MTNGRHGGVFYTQGMSRVLRAFLAFLSVAIYSAAGPAIVAMGQEIVAIEEDWELVVGNPDTNSAGPQVTCTIAPIGDLTGLHAVLEINHRTLHGYAPGGLQLQIWNGEEPIDIVELPDRGLLRHVSETIRWTHRMQLEDGQLTFEIVNGSSISWNQFGEPGTVRRVCNTSLSNLNHYNRDVSVKHSGIGYAANRVDQLVMKEKRVYLSTGEVLTDTTSRFVHGE